MAGLIDSLKKQDFGEKDSMIASAVMNPKKAAGLLKAWFDTQVNTGLGRPTLDENTGLFLTPTDEQRHAAALELAGMAELGSFPAAPKSAGGTLGTFIGPKSKHWNAKAAEEAAKMLDEGMSPTEVWRMKLFGRWPDGNMFSEIDDSQALYRGLQGAKDAYAGDAYIHPELYDNYPTLENMTVKERPGVGGQYDPAAWEFTIGRDKMPDSTMAHEVHHPIQDVEGWGRGGSPKQLGVETYRRLFGEAAARAAQDRLNMNMLQRRGNYPLEGGKLSDIPIEDLIYRYSNSGPQQSKGLINALPETEFSKAHKIAQQNAALPVEQGGLGLSPNNTAMDRAKALNYDIDTPLYRGSNSDESVAGLSKYSGEQYAATTPYIANTYALPTKEGGQNVMPMMGSREFLHDDNVALKWGDGNKEYSFPPGYIRSRFAAFDPMKKNSANILATGLLGSLLLQHLDDKNKGQK